MNRVHIAAICVVLILIATASVHLAFQDEGGSGDGDGMYRGYDALYGYTTSGATSDTYASRLDSVVSDVDVLFIQSALEGYPLTTIGPRALEGCSSETVFLPSTVTSLEQGALDGCPAERLVFLGGLPNGVDPGDGRLLTLDVHGGAVETVEVDSDGWSLEFLVWDGEAIVISAEGTGSLEVPGVVESSDGTACPVTMVGCDSFRQSSFSSVVFPPSLERIGTRAFYGCEGLVDVILPEGLDSVEDEAFRHCYGLTDTDLVGVSFIGFEAFRGCSSMTSVTIPDTVTFLGAGAFYVCPSVESVVVGSGVSEIPDRAFGYGSSLTSVEIRGEVLSVGSYAFAMCRVLEGVSLPDVRSLGSSAFTECRMLSEIDLGSVESVESGAFTNCRSMTSLEFPDTLASLGSEVFAGCRALADLWFHGPMPSMEDDSLLGVDCVVHVASEHADSWSGFGGGVQVF